MLFRSGLVLALCATVIFGYMYSAFKYTPDPLTGWNEVYNQAPEPAIVKDYRIYISSLPASEQTHIGPIFYFKDAEGKHAIKFEIAVGWTNWTHVLFYDEKNKRIKVVKYVSGHSLS